jgi:hypothetical protein
MFAESAISTVPQGTTFCTQGNELPPGRDRILITLLVSVLSGMNLREGRQFSDDIILGGGGHSPELGMGALVLVPPDPPEDTTGSDAAALGTMGSEGTTGNDAAAPGAAG